MSDVCKHPECGRVRRAKGYCSTHYKRAFRGLDMDAPIAIPIPILERFMQKVEVAPTGCIEWVGATNGVGYGMFFVRWEAGKDVRMLAHRWNYERVRGAIPEGLHLDHLCRNTLCVNPEHLEAVTQRENSLRGTGMSARHAVKTHCDSGHPFSGDNLAFRSNGRWRDCLECRRAKHRRYYHAKKKAI